MNQGSQNQQADSEQAHADAGEQSLQLEDKTAQQTDYEAISPKERYYLLCRGKYKLDDLSDEDKADIIRELRETTWYVDPMPQLFPDDPKGEERAKIEKLIEQKIAKEVH